MKILMMFGIGVLAAALGCQSAEPSVVKAGDADAEIPRVTDSKQVQKSGDHPHEEPGDKKAPRISLEDAKKAYNNGEAVFVDTRGSAFFQNEHVKGAINVPSSDFDDAYKSVPKDKKIIAYCS